MSVRATPSLAVPQTQNTAPVLEFNCLYTHEIRRKQKRWQDGFLRFHTFNKRIMVYDVPRNFIGDAHWNAEELHEGDEVTLEKGGVLVQVAESVGRTETDLTELLKSKKKSSGAAAASSSPIRAATMYQPQLRQANQPNRHASINAVQLGHRSLNVLLGTPKGRIGKALLPSKSPFDERHEVENEPWEGHRPRKRPRIEEASQRQRAEAHRARILDLSMERPFETTKQRRGTKEIIDLRSDISDHDQFMVGFSDNALASTQSSSQLRPHVAKASATVRSSSPAFQRQKTPEKENSSRRTPISNAQAKKATDPANAPIDISPQSGPANGSTSEYRLGQYVRDTQCAIPTSEPSTKSAPGGESRSGTRSKARSSPEAGGAKNAPLQKESLVVEERHPHGARHPPSCRSGKTLRMATGAPKRKTLLCQDQLFAKSHHASGSESVRSADPSEQVASKHFNKTSQRQQLEQRLAKIRKKGQRSPDQMPEFSARPNARRASIDEANSPPLSLDAAGAMTAQQDRTVIAMNKQHSPKSMADLDSNHRQLRRAVSESNHLTNGTSDRIPQPVAHSRASLAKEKLASAAEHVLRDDGRNLLTTARLAPGGKKPMNRAVSLNLAANGTSTVILNREFPPPKPPNVNAALPDVVANAWSREAFDLFSWRPPGWDEEKWCVKGRDSVAATEA